MDGRRHAVPLALVALVLVAVGVGVLWAEQGSAAEPVSVPRVAVTNVLAELPREPEVPVERDPLPTPPETRAAFEERYPEQAEAVRGDEPGEDHWALLIGINEHLGPVADNFASRQDAEVLRDVLLDAGWDDERIVLMTDTDATGVMIREGLSWLARKAGDDATLALHYSGHSKKWYGDGGAILDIGLWPTDDDFIHRDELAESLAAIPHGRLWGNFATCNAEALHEAGLDDERRVLTYSSQAPEKSYEDPAAGHSVWGRFLLDETLRQGAADGDGGPTSIQDAFEIAAPQATERTAGQSYGAQTPVLHDGPGEPFDLTVEVARS